MDMTKYLAFVGAMDVAYRHAHSMIFATNIAARDMLIKEFGISKEDAENIVVEMNNKYQKGVLKAAIIADSERGGA